MPRHYYLFGRPVSASLSPVMHNAAFRALGLDADYAAVEITPEDFLGAAAAFIARDDFGGANVTIPHKQAAVAFCARLSPEATAAGAVNTLVVDSSLPSPCVRGENTDVTAIRAILGDHPSAAGRTAVLLGAGGAAAACVVAMATMPAGGAFAKLVILNRTAAPAESLAVKARRMGLPAEAALLDRAPIGRLTGVGAVINATPLRTADDWAPAGFLDALGHGRPVVIDMAYGRGPTVLLKTAAAAGCPVVDGREVLVAQGAASFALWTGRAAPLAVMRKAVYNERSQPCFAT